MPQITTTFDDTEEDSYFTSGNTWVTRAATDAVKKKGLVKPEARVTIYAKVESNEGVNIHEVVKWTADDLYAYAQPPQVDLANFFGELNEKLGELDPNDPLGFEAATVAFWNQAKKLRAYLGVSANYDEAISAFQIMAIGYNSILDSEKLAALQAVLTALGEIINLDEDLLDEQLDLLEAGGFDLKSPVQFN